VNNPFYGRSQVDALDPDDHAQTIAAALPEFTTVNGGSAYWAIRLSRLRAQDRKALFARISVLASYTASKLIDDLQARGRAVSALPSRTGTTCARAIEELSDVPQRLVLTVYGSYRINRRTAAERRVWRLAAQRH